MLNHKKRESANKIWPEFSTVLRVGTKEFIKFISLKYLQIWTFLEASQGQSLHITARRPETCNFIKNETLAQVFSWEFCEISKNTFSYRTFPSMFASLIGRNTTYKRSYSMQKVLSPSFFKHPLPPSIWTYF